MGLRSRAWSFAVRKRSVRVFTKIILNWPSRTRAALTLLANIFIFDVVSVVSLSGFLTTLAKGCCCKLTLYLNKQINDDDDGDAIFLETKGLGEDGAL